MAEFNASFRVSADSSQFEREMAKVTTTTQQVGKKISSAFDGKAIGATLATALGISLTSIADKVARFWTGFSKDAEDALEAMVAATGKAADAQERALEKLRQAKQKKEDEDSKRAEDQWEMLIKARREGNEQIAKEEAEAAKNKREAVADLAQFDEQARFNALSSQKQLNELTREEGELKKTISSFEEDVKKNGFESADSAKLLLELKQRQSQVQGEIKSLTAGIAADESRITKETEKQIEKKQVLAGIAGIRGSKQFGEASNEALQEQLRRNQNQIQGIGPIRNIGQDLEVARLQAEILNIKQELDFRSKLSGDVSRLGIEGARRTFQGDPLAFDRLIQQYVNDSRDMREITAQSNDLLRQINERQKNGIAVVNMNR